MSNNDLLGPFPLSYSKRIWGQVLNFFSQLLKLSASAPQKEEVENVQDLLSCTNEDTICVRLEVPRTQGGTPHLRAPMCPQEVVLICSLKSSSMSLCHGKDQGLGFRISWIWISYANYWMTLEKLTSLNLSFFISEVEIILMIQNYFEGWL